MRLSRHGHAFLLSIALASPSAATSDVYKLAYTVPWSPLNTTSVDQGAIYNGSYYLSDRVNKGVHVVSLAADKQITIIGGFQGSVKVHGKADNSLSGPNGLVILPDRNELYAADSNGTVRVIDLFTKRIVANISTGGTYRADEMAYDAHTGTVAVTLPDDTPPKVALIQAQHRKTLGTVIFTNASGLEQPAFNPADGLFYVAVPSSGASPGGAIAVVDGSSLKIIRTLPLKQCLPAGIAFGPGQSLFIGCSQDQILKYGVAYSQIMDVSSGRIVANISDLAGIDQVTYDSKVKFYYASAYQNLNGGSKTGSPKPQLGVVDAQTNKLIQTWTTDNVTAHSVAVDPATNQVVVPLEKFGIAVYNLTSSSTTSSTSGSATTTAAAKQTQTNAASVFGTSFLSTSLVVASLLAGILIR